MYELTVRRHFDAAHYLRGYPGQCGRLHGHTWQVEVTVAGERLDEYGMLIDFHALKEMVAGVVAELDHQHLNDLEPFHKPGGETNPTAENIARYLYRRLKPKLRPGLALVKVKIRESSDAWACYYEEKSFPGE